MTIKSFKLIYSIFLLVFSSSLIAQDEEGASKKQPAYVSLGDKPMVLNLNSGGKRLSFLQVKAEVLVKDNDAKEVVEANIPAIRHKLILLLSEQSVTDMKTPGKREDIRKKLGTEIRDMIEDMTDNNDIEEILFSSFLVQ